MSETNGAQRATTGTDESTDDLLELEIGPVAAGGWCVARHAGKVVFVRHTLPGELVKARITEETAKLVRADAVEIIRPSPDRVVPPCPFAGPGRCGGCDWQHASLAAQRRLKAATVAEQLQRIAGIDLAVQVEALAGDEGPDADGLGWRTRVQFAVRRDGAVGFRRHRSHDIEPIDECLLAHDDVEVLGIETNRWPGAARVEGVASGTTGDRLVAVTPRPTGGGGRPRSGGAGRAAHGVRRVRVPRLGAPVRVVQGEPQAGPALPYVREVAAERTWQISGAGFWQVHPDAAEALTAAVLDGLKPRPGESVLDLYCGVGLFLGALADRVGPDADLFGVEESPIAVHDARYNLRDLRNVTIRAGRVEALIDGLAPADLVVLDPPRTGVGREVAAGIAAVARRAFAYVSCDPATLARDLGYFADGGWRLAGLRTFDAFPMTHHVECVAILRPEGGTRA